MCKVHPKKEEDPDRDLLICPLCARVCLVLQVGYICALGDPGTKPACSGHSRVPNLVASVILGHQTCLLGSFSGTKPGCFGHSRVPNLVIVILGHQTWLLWSFSGTKPGCFGHPRVCTRVASE